MFGYITPLLNELKLSDYNTFKSYYCGLCLAIKNKFGNIPRLSLSYDTTFFAILLDGLSNEQYTIISKPCIKHPLSKRDFIISTNALDYACDLNLSLFYYKILDDVYDDNTLKSIALSKFINHYHKKLFYKNIDTTIKKNLDILHSIEKSSSINSIDVAANPFGNIIGKVLEDYPFELNEDCKDLRKKLFDFGYYFGKWIYLIDALDDLKKDMENNKFNPIEKAYNNYSLNYSDLLNTVREKIDFNLMLLASNCSDIIKVLPFTKNKNIVENVINLGLVDKYSNISSNL